MCYRTSLLILIFLAASQAFQSLYITQQYGRTRLGFGRTSARCATAYAEDELISSPSQVHSFRERMRQSLIIEDQRKRIKSRATKEGNIIEVRTLQNYKEEVADERDRMVVVRFYAPWCRACKAMQPLFHKLSNAQFAKERNVKFLDVPVTEDNANLHQGLGVPSLPFCHIYHPEAGLVEELRFTKKRVRNVAKILHSYLQEQCSEIEMDTETNMFSSPFKED